LVYTSLRCLEIKTRVSEDVNRKRTRTVRVVNNIVDVKDQEDREVSGDNIKHVTTLPLRTITHSSTEGSL
jgi:hypothetical protein